MKKEASFFQALVEHSVGAIALLDLDGVIRYQNPAVKYVLGFDHHMMIGVHACSFVHPDDLASAQNFFQELISNEIITDDQFRCRHHDGGWRWIEVVGINLLAQPNVKALVLDYRDISARKYAEEQVQQLAMEQVRGQLLQRFIGDVSHDLNTPITSIKLSLDILRKVPEPKKQLRQIEILEAQVSHLQDVLADMINMSSLDSDVGAVREQIELNTLVFNLIRDQQFLVVQKSHRLEFSPSTDPLPILADSRQLRHVIIAIFTNALKYTSSDGQIFIRTCDETGYAVFEVQDNGIGISPTDLPHIFERFYRADQARGTQHGGAGLGLAISKKIIDAHLGTIDVESQLGEGTTVCVRIPLAESTSSSQDSRSSSSR